MTIQEDYTTKKGSYRNTIVYHSGVEIAQIIWAGGVKYEPSWLTKLSVINSDLISSEKLFKSKKAALSEFIKLHQESK